MTKDELMEFARRGMAAQTAVDELTTEAMTGRWAVIGHDEHMNAGLFDSEEAAVAWLNEHGDAFADGSQIRWIDPPESFDEGGEEDAEASGNGAGGRPVA
jgi:hypothetical protein